MKGKCQPLENFEASSVIVFAALVAGDFSAANAFAQQARAATRSAVRTSQACDTAKRRSSVRTAANGENNRAQQAPAADFRRNAIGNAASIAIARLDAGCTAGFVPLDGAG